MNENKCINEVGFELGAYIYVPCSKNRISSRQNLQIMIIIKNIYILYIIYLEGPMYIKIIPSK